MNSYINSDINSYIPIERLLATQRASDTKIVSNEGRYYNWNAWLTRVAAWRERLKTRVEQRWALYHEDAGEFSAILFALWSLGKIAYLPGNKQPGLIETLSAEVDGFIGDYDGCIASLSLDERDFDQVNREQVNREQLAEMAGVVLQTDVPLLQVYTSGSTGRPQAIGKTLQQLSSEVDHLQALWGDLTCSALVLSTVSHQHIYGLLFRVLWPLACGACIESRSCAYLEEIPFRLASAEKYLGSHYPFILVSSPTHLSRVSEGLLGDPNTACRQTLRAVFSSGAPLARKHSLQIREKFHLGVLEIYGSSETGGIAWRQQESENESLWQAMPGVQVRADDTEQCLEVCSSHLPEALRWFQVPDRVRFDSFGNFELLGRIDRVVKIEGKRASLDELELWMLKHEAIEAVKVVALDGHRSEIGAVVVLSKEAKQALSEEHKHTVNQLFRKHMQKNFALPLVPRRWRYVESLPINSQGKVLKGELLKLFTQGEPFEQKVEHRRSKLPVELDREFITPNHVCVQLQVPKDLLFFDGHFDKAAILPGVVQIHWAEYFSRQLLPLEGEFARLEVVKFQKIITPGHVLSLELLYNSAKQKVNFTYSSGTGKHSSGRLVLGE